MKQDPYLKTSRQKVENDRLEYIKELCDELNTTFDIDFINTMTGDDFKDYIKYLENSLNPSMYSDDYVY